MFLNIVDFDQCLLEVLIDHQSIEDKTVTIRERDSMVQKRIKIDKAFDEIIQQVSINNILKSL